MCRQATERTYFRDVDELRWRPGNYRSQRVDEEEYWRNIETTYISSMGKMASDDI